MEKTYIKAIATFEDGHTLTYEKESIIELMKIQARLLERDIRFEKLGLECSKLESFKISR